MSKEIENKLHSILSDNIELNIAVDQIGLDDNLLSLGMDSINSIKVIVAIESEFGFVFYDEDLTVDNVKTINKIISYIKSRI